MAIEPITRKEQFLAKAGGQQVGDLKPITREEMFLQKIAENGGGSGGGAQADWNAAEGEAGHVLNRPFWKEVVKKSLTEMMTGETTVTVTTVENGGLNFAQGAFGVAPDTTNYVIFDGVEYECTPYYDASVSTVVIGSFDFSEYPFLITNGMIITKTAGEHTVEQYFDEVAIRANYAPYLEIKTEKTEDRTPYLTMEDVEKIKTAFTNGVPVRLDSIYRGVALTMNVSEVTESFICAFSIQEEGYGCIEQITYRFSVGDGSLSYSGVFTLGQVIENGSHFPVMYINNRYYKITVADDGTLTATEI